MALDCNEEDLERYLRDEMDFMMGDEAFKERIAKDVLARANGNFWWAHLVVQEVLSCQTETQVQKALNEVPMKLEPVYQRMDTQLDEMHRSRTSMFNWAATL